MPVYRPDPGLITRQLTSLREQSLRDWHCLLGIDGVDPTARQLLEDLTAEDQRFEIHEFDDNVGVYRHVERLLALIEPGTQWLALADQDDFWYPEKLETLVHTLRSSGAAAVSGQARVVTSEGEVRGVTDRRSATTSELLLRNQVTGSLTVFSVESVRDALPFPRATAIAIHDHWLAVLASTRGPVMVLDAIVQDYVQHGANVIGEASRTTGRAELQRARGAGGLRAYLDYVAAERWGWRVALAEGLTDRKLEQDPLVSAIQSRGVSRTLVTTLGRTLVRRRLRLRGAAGTLLSAWWADRRKGTS